MGQISVKKLHSFLGHNDSIYTLEKVDEQRFLSAGGDGMVVLWDLKTPDQGEVILKIPNSIYAMAYDKTGDSLYVGQNNSGIHKINFSSKKEVRSVDLGNHQIYVIKVIGGTIWVGLQSGEIVVLSYELEVLRRIKLSKERVRSIDVYGDEIAVGFSDNHIRILDKKSGGLIKELKGHANSVFTVKYHPSGKYLATVGRDAHIKVWDTTEDYVLRESIAGHLYTINDLVYWRDGRYYLTAGKDKVIKLWDAYNFRLLKVLDKHRHLGHESSVNKLLLMEYQDLLVSCSDDRSIYLWKIDFEE